MKYSFFYSNRIYYYRKGGISLKNENLDELIKKYSRELVSMGGSQHTESITVTDVPESLSVDLLTAPKPNPDEDQTASYEAEITDNKAPEEPSEEAYEKESEKQASPVPEVLINEEKATSCASFFAEIFTGEGAFPVAGAKVVVYRGDNIYAFLETDERGRTKLIRLPAFSKENSLEPESSKQTVEYLADVFSPGFVSQKGLTVSAVGGSDIVLSVFLVPEEERMS